MPRFACALLGLVAAASAFAAEPPDAKQLLEGFRAERAESVKGFTAAELAPADALAARAQAALDAGNAASAARLAREARWQLPFTPPGLPAHVKRVLGVSRLRHADRVNALAYSPDGTRLASASRDGTVRLWNLDNGRELLVYRKHLDKPEPPGEQVNPFRVAALAFSPDGKRLASYGERELHVWNPETGERELAIPNPPGTAKQAQPARGLAFTPDGARLLASGGDDQRVSVWDAKTGKALFSYASQAGRIEGLAVNAKGTLVATVNSAGELFVYPLGDKPQPPRMSAPVGGGSAVLAVAFAGTTPNILTGSADGTAKLIAGPEGGVAGLGTVLATYAGHTAKVTSLAAAADGKRFVTGSADRTVRVWDAARQQTLFRFAASGSGVPEPGRESGVVAVALSPDGTQVAAGTVEGVIQLWPLTSHDENRASGEAMDSLWSVAVSPDGKRTATAGADRQIRVYDTATGKLEATLTGHKGAVAAVAFLSDTVLASASGDRTAKLWNLATKEPTELKGHGAAVLALAADPAGKFLATGSADQAVRGFSPAGEELWRWQGRSAVCALAVSPDGSRVVAGSADGLLTLLDVRALASKAPVTVLAQTVAHTGGVAALSVAPDGSRVASCGGDGVVRVWAITNLKPNAGLALLAKLEPLTRASGPGGLTPLSAVQFSPNGRALVLAGSDGAVRLWDVATAVELRAFRAHTDWVTAAAFTPDGRNVVSVSVDKTLRQFPLPRAEAADLGHLGAVYGVAFSRDGQTLATCSADRTAKLWDVGTGQIRTTFTGSPAPLTAVAFGPDGLPVTGGEDGRLRYWAESGREAKSVPLGAPVFALAVDPGSGRVAAVWSRREERSTGLAVFPTPAAAAVETLDKGRVVQSLALSGDGTLGATAGEDGLVKLWNLATKAQVGPDWPLAKSTVDMAFRADNKALLALNAAGEVRVATIADRSSAEAIQVGNAAGLAISPASERFVTWGSDGTVKLWTLAGKLERSWTLTTPAVCAAFSPDGKRLATGNRDGTACILELP